MSNSSESTIRQSPAVTEPRVRPGRHTLLNLEVLRAISAECAYSASALAKHLGISIRQLQRLFTRQTGCPPRTWLREERLQAAHRLLLHSASVKEVALTLSFRQASQFCRDFRSRFGYTPSTLQKSRRSAAVDSRGAGSSAWELGKDAQDPEPLGGLGLAFGFSAENYQRAQRPAKRAQPAASAALPPYMVSAIAKVAASSCA